MRLKSPPTGCIFMLNSVFSKSRNFVFKNRFLIFRNYSASCYKSNNIIIIFKKFCDAIAVVPPCVYSCINISDVVVIASAVVIFLVLVANILIYLSIFADLFIQIA